MRVHLKVAGKKRDSPAVEVSRAKFLIGRQKGCHLRINSPHVSRTHCLIIVRDGHVIVRDLRSRHGTFVNDDRVQDDVELKSADRLTVAKFEFEVLIEGGESSSPDKQQDRSRPAVPGSKDKDGEISDWLEEADQVDRELRMSDPDSRRAKIVIEGPPETQEAVEDDGETKKKLPPRQKPGKLPKKPFIADSSEDAAKKVLGELGRQLKRPPSK